MQSDVFVSKFVEGWGHFCMLTCGSGSSYMVEVVFSCVVVVLCSVGFAKVKCCFMFGTSIVYDLLAPFRCAL